MPLKNLYFCPDITNGINIDAVNLLLKRNMLEQKNLKKKKKVLVLF